MGGQSDGVSICAILADGFPAAIGWVDSQESSRPLDTVQHGADTDEKSSIFEFLLSNLLPLPCGQIRGKQSTVTLGGVQHALQACCGRGPMQAPDWPTCLQGWHRLYIRHGAEEHQSARTYRTLSLEKVFLTVHSTLPKSQAENRHCAGKRCRVMPHGFYRTIVGVSMLLTPILYHFLLRMSVVRWHLKFHT